MVFEAPFAFLIGFVGRDGGRHRGALLKHALWTAYSGFVFVVSSMVGWTTVCWDPLRKE